MKTIFKKIKDSEKGAALTLEVLIAIPIIMFVVWGTVNVFLYLLATHQFNSAAYEAARGAAMDMKGHEGTIQGNGLQTRIRDTVRNQAKNVISQNKFIEMFNNPNVDFAEPEIIVDDGPNNAPTNDTNCMLTFNQLSEENVICAYVQKSDIGGKSHEQVVVLMKSDFKFVGNWVPFWDGVLRVKAKAVVQKELPDRYEYVD